jgi:NifU-like protein involved in Fe-S cluster formation
MDSMVSYNDIVRQLFAAPEHAGDLSTACAQTLSATASESTRGAELVLVAGIDADQITAMAYRVRGCPHLIAALELFCDFLEGQPVSALEKPKIADITEQLSIPVEKSGRILLLEDAAAMLWSQVAGIKTAGVKTRA